MRSLKKILGIIAVALIVGGCGGGGGSGGSGDGESQPKDSTVTFKENKKVAIITADKQDSLLDRTIDDKNSSVKYITIDSKLAQEVDNKEIISIANSDKYPLGYIGKIIGREKLPDGSLKLKLTKVSIEDFKEIPIPKMDTKIEDLNFVGVISPFMESGNSQKRLKTIYSKTWGANFDGKAINLGVNGEAKYEITKKKFFIILKGSIKNVNIKNEGLFEIDSSWKDLIKINFREDFKLSYDSIIELSLVGQYKDAVGHFDKMWKKMEEASFKDFGIDISGEFTGLSSIDKKGKIPIAGFVYNGITVPVKSIKQAKKVTKAGGIILWLYADLSGKLFFEGSMGIRANQHTELIFKKKMNSNDLYLKLTNDNIKGKRFLEAPFINGRGKLEIENGLSLEADIVVAGVRVLNARGFVGGRLKEELTTKKELSYGLDTPSSEWSWSKGELCLDGSWGAGALFNIDFLVGLKRKAKVLSFDEKLHFNYQYPNQKYIDKMIRDGRMGRVGSWWNIPLNRGCYNIETPPQLIENHVARKRMPIGEDQLKDISDKYFKYAYLSNRVYDDKPSNEGKKENNWETIDIFNNNINGFKVGLYKNTVTGECIVSYGGTTANSYDNFVGKAYDTTIDIITDVNLFNVISLGQPTNALQYYRNMKKKSECSKIDGITGHSLGGGLAQYVGLYSGIKTVKFNTAPLPFNVLGSYFDFEVEVFKDDTFKDVVSIKTPSFNLGLEPNNFKKYMQNVEFLHKDKITNIMTPYDPISTISTAI